MRIRILLRLALDNPRASGLRRRPPRIGPALCGLSLLLLSTTHAGPAAEAVYTPRHLLVRVRDTPPHGAAAFHRERDGSYTVSTGGGGDRDDLAPAGAANNATIVSTTGSVRLVRVLEGERVRVDLPSVQSLQFHVPIAGGGAGTPRPAAPGGRTPSAGATPGAAGGSAARSGSGPAASGVVFFEAVTAFVARFALAPPGVRIELEPLRAGSVAAPYGGTGTDPPPAVTLLGRVGEWIALGDSDVQAYGKSLNATAEPATPASVWVRVDPDPGDQP
ncbi:exported hypothetical protein [Burkholderiales bacterium]|jgi:hypothetical protein|nr:exported hypothetical protein [Burkholderiales bacterium]